MIKIALFGKTLRPENASYLQLLIDKLENMGCNIIVYEAFRKEIQSLVTIRSAHGVFSQHSDLPGKADYLLSIGGDGTLLDTITLVRDSGIPVLGINLGRLGFLSSVPRDNIVQAIDELLESRFSIDERSLLRLDTAISLFGDVNYALNELTLHKRDPHSMITVRVDVNGQFLNSYWADGLLVATPTGSTAYSLSASGPIVSPDANVFIITPIASHNLTVRPIVIPDSSEITLTVEGRESRYHLGLDSRYQRLDKPVALRITKEKFTLKLIQLEHEAFFTTIRKKLNWGLDNRN